MMRIYILVFLIGILYILSFVLPKSTPSSSHPALFYDNKEFLQAVGSTKKTQSSYAIGGGIVPHHLLVSGIIADFFSRLALQSPKTIILLGPNHPERGEYAVLTSLYGWQTPFGTVEPNKDSIQSLLDQHLAKIDEEIISKEYSVAGLMPFIKYYMPQTTVVPLILKKNISQEEVARLAHGIETTGSNTVVVASVDFSHYLTNREAMQKDEVTLSAIKAFDYRQILSFNSDFLDSPASIATLLMIMKDHKKTHFDILEHTNSGKMAGDNSISTTSYFSIFLY